VVYGDRAIARGGLREEESGSPSDALNRCLEWYGRGSAGRRTGLANMGCMKGSAVVAELARVETDMGSGTISGSKESRSCSHELKYGQPVGYWFGKLVGTLVLNRSRLCGAE